MTPKPTRPPTEEEQFFLKQSYENIVTGLDHIEAMARHVVSAVGVVAGLTLAAAQLQTGSGPAAAHLGLIGPFFCWIVSLLLATLVIFPMRHRHLEGAPASIRDAFVRLRLRKWRLLLGAVLAFAAGLIWALLSLTR